MTVKMVCEECGSDRVESEASAQWNFEKQQWEVLQVFEHTGYCAECNKDRQIVEKEAA